MEKSIVLCLVLALSTSLSAKTLVISQVTDRPKKDFKQLRPMASYMLKHLKPFGYTKSKVKLYKSTEKLCQAINKGEVDWVTDTSLVASKLIHECAISAHLVKWKKGQKQYSSYLFTTRDSPINTIEDLVGKRLAFESKDSFSSYYLPKSILLEANIALQKVDNIRKPYPKDKTAYIFSRNEKNNVLMVLNRLVDAGAVNNGDWENPKIISDEIKQELKVIHHSKPYPRALELFANALPDDVKAKMETVLIALTPEKEPDLLLRYEKTSGFNKISQEAQDTLTHIYKVSKNWD